MISNSWVCEVGEKKKKKKIESHNLLTYLPTRASLPSLSKPAEALPTASASCGSKQLFKIKVSRIPGPGGIRAEVCPPLYSFPHLLFICKTTSGVLGDPIPKPRECVSLVQLPQRLLQTFKEK